MTRIAIVGASGFVGSHLLKRFAETQHDIIALTRTKPSPLPSNATWRKIDLFSAQSTTKALKDVDVAIYLVHSMIPSSRLFQGDFHDTDLLLANNFAHACVFHKVKRILYLGGVMPEGYISPHLASRLEVEEVLRSTGVCTTILRAGMIVGPGGSSFEILKTLVQRLPWMILPEWTKRSTQAIFIDDVVTVIAKAAQEDVFGGKTLDVVSGESLNYKTLLHTTARALGLKRLMIPVPIKSVGFSKFWVRTFGHSTKELVSPLVDSLLCDLPQIKPDLLIEPLIAYKTFDAMVKASLERESAIPQKKAMRTMPLPHSVRSVQRLPALPNHDCHWLVREYMAWLPRFFSNLLRVELSADQRTVSFYLFPLRKALLILQYSRESTSGDAQALDIIGGLLAKEKQTGWLEFNQVCDRRYTLAAIHDFVPSLPWPLYRLTQAPMHQFVMTAFGRYLRRKT